ncbi:hypothetical protein R6Q59_013117 [Mikania micrantha]
MENSIVPKDEFEHFSHDHSLSLVYLQQKNQKNENDSDEDEERDEETEDGFVEENLHGGECNMCKEQILSFDVCYYYCKPCDYSLHKFCAELPMILQNHPLHPQHDLSLFFPFENFPMQCILCKHNRKTIRFYGCNTCKINIDIICATLRERKINHPSHPHQMELMPQPIVSSCSACGTGKIHKNFKDDEHPNLLHCPFHDEGDNLLKRHMSNQIEFTGKQHEADMINHSVHHHPLIIFNKQTPDSKKMVSLHNPMKRIQLLCDGCVKPILTEPFYICNQQADEQCCFILHEWCAKLPLKIQDYMDHPEHTLFLLPKVPGMFFSVFTCAICNLPSNGFAYGCMMCEFYIDINCAFIPEKITHDAHPGHLLYKVDPSITRRLCGTCSACLWDMYNSWGFRCPSCDYYIHVGCALLLYRVIKHKCDKHPLSLRYEPAENHISDYFCEICEHELDPWKWFYHCTTCAQSTHAACAPLVLQYEQATGVGYYESVHKFRNVKFGGTLMIKGHSHRLTFVERIDSNGKCFKCDRWLQGMIFKCLECKFGLHCECVS